VESTRQRGQTESELAALRRSVQRGTPYGEDRWQKRTVEALGLQSTMRRAVDRALPAGVAEKRNLTHLFLFVESFEFAQERVIPAG